MLFSPTRWTLRRGQTAASMSMTSKRQHAKTHLALDTTHFLFSFKLRIKAAHARCAYACGCQCTVNFLLPLVSWIRPRNISKTLFLVLGYPGFTLIPCGFSRIVVNV